jgi:DNA polymerase III epsilon subunit-like protein
MTYIKPSSESKLIWDPGAEAVHGISQEFLKNEPDEKMAMEAFVAFCQANFPLRIAGFNCPFDNAVIDAAIDRQQCFLPEFVTPFYDVMDVAKEQLSLPRNRLVDIREHFGISCSGAHDAARDIYDTLKIARLLRAMKKAAA